MLYLIATWLATPFLYLRLALTSRSSGQPLHILVIQTAKIGDMICTTPIFREIKRNRPDSKVSVLCSPLTAPLLAHNPHVDSVLAFDTKTLAGLLGKVRFMRFLHAQRIDMLICASPNLAFLLAPLWARIRIRASVLPNFFGTTYWLAQPLLTHRTKHKQGRLFIDTVFLLLERLGFDIKERHKEVYTSPQAEEKVTELLNAFPSTNMVGVGISSGNKLKALTKETLAELIRLLLTRTNCEVILLGTSDDKPLGKLLEKELATSRIMNAAGVLSLQELPALIKRLSLYIGVDSGITYMADALDIDVIDIMGPADPEDQRPTGNKAQVILTSLPCAPCSHTFRAPYDCAVGTRACVLNISAEDIFKRVNSTLDLIT